MGMKGIPMLYSAAFLAGTIVITGTVLGGLYLLCRHARPDEEKPPKKTADVRFQMNEPSYRGRLQRDVQVVAKTVARPSLAFYVAARLGLELPQTRRPLCCERRNG